MHVLAHSRRATARKLITAKIIATELTVEPCDSTIMGSNKNRQKHKNRK
jgi:hypothetical protein